MQPTPRIERLTDITEVVALAAIAREEGFQFLDRLVEEWRTGTNRFEKPGEAIFGAFIGDKLVGTGGLTAQRENLGRVRRVYVHPEHRRKGIANLLMRNVLQIAKSNFQELVLYTETDEAKAMYEQIGFYPESPDGPDRATHRLQW